MELTVSTIFQDLHKIDYKEAWEYQEKLQSELMSLKLSNSYPRNNYLLFCEHPHVYTLGKSGQFSNLLIDDNFLAKINATYYKTNRGGDITYHGPGQIVGYPIIDLEGLGIGIKTYVYLMEESIIKTLNIYNIQAERLEGATGVWLDSQIQGRARKICAIGIRVSRGITMHGFAFNVNTDLNYFSHINPCGFVDKSVTSMQKELGSVVAVEDVKNQLKMNLAELLKLELL